MSIKYIENSAVEQEFSRRIRQLEANWQFMLREQLLGIAEEIARALKKQQMNRSDLASKLGVSRANITKLLRGTRDIKLSTLFKIASVLELKPELKFVSRRTEHTSNFVYPLGPAASKSVVLRGQFADWVRASIPATECSHSLKSVLYTHKKPKQSSPAVEKHEEEYVQANQS